ncbi:hypothetical protein [Pseudobacteriovorax antillogorgiicola]|uniref:Lipoprotein n=1 Tax=Pseudobacteriovorax antillogorgiicola TaxID=1513793 RepID=A0A1Y6BQW9_9BACT|nr:hypothetical protein [Pseudobacteriovorax antillogorgiicola]TCS53183.1 hypothetical protein EDD56_108234 [Pseudobacteriovorax antillogorgiicola]SMF24524.1 hypothetical protein SAMN06296036_10812 [Pseudobacteriovorax antillogorgiicola]
MKYVLPLAFALSVTACNNDDDKKNSDGPGKEGQGLTLRSTEKLMADAKMNVIPSDFKNTATSPKDVSKAFDSMDAKKLVPQKKTAGGVIANFVKSASAKEGGGKGGAVAPAIACDQLFDGIDTFLDEGNSAVGELVTEVDNAISGKDNPMNLYVETPKENEVFRIRADIEALDSEDSDEEGTSGNVSGDVIVSGGANDTQAFLKFSGDMNISELELNDEASLVDQKIKTDIEVFAENGDDPKLGFGAGVEMLATDAEGSEVKVDSALKLEIKGGKLPSYTLTGSGNGVFEKTKGTFSFDSSLTTQEDLSLEFIFDASLSAPEGNEKLKITSKLQNSSRGCFAVETTCEGNEQACDLVVGVVAR